LTTLSINSHQDKRAFVNKLLKATGATWLTTAILGQWFFALYILMFYGGHAVNNNWEAWSNRMIHGFVQGDWLGNLSVFLHITLAFVITFCGPLQLIPQFRTYFPKFHRWNGRVYMITALVISVSSIYMIWAREAIIGGLSGQLGTTFDGLLIITFAIIATRYAMKGQINRHQRWALRLFIVVSGVWFFRVIRGFWILINNGTSPGSNGNLTGPFDMVLNFAGYLIPLLILELYFVIKLRGTASMQLGMAVALLGLTIATGLGIYSAGNIFWLPNI